jgi:hypothetical protein
VYRSSARLDFPAVPSHFAECLPHFDQLLFRKERKGMIKPKSIQWLQVWENLGLFIWVFWRHTTPSGDSY